MAVRSLQESTSRAPGLPATTTVTLAWGALALTALLSLGAMASAVTDLAGSAGEPGAFNSALRVEIPVFGLSFVSLGFLVVSRAVYFCCLEALQNVQKYADASQVTVRLDEADGELHFQVEDDGRGFDPATTRRGSGLANMGDRLDPLGGRIDLDSQVGAGVRVRGTIPITVAAPA